MARRKKNNKSTTISIQWVDKETFRKHARLLKQTKSGSRYESDSILFKRILEVFISQAGKGHDEPKSTYPSLNKSQPNFDSSESN